MGATSTPPRSMRAAADRAMWRGRRLQPLAPPAPAAVAATCALRAPLLRLEALITWHGHTDRAAGSRTVPGALVAQPERRLLAGIAGTGYVAICDTSVGVEACAKPLRPS